MKKKYVAYYRVSTKKQGKSGLGLDAQKADVERIANGDGIVIESFIETESGKKNDRPELQRAIDHAKKYDATLIIAKLDRLARDVAFVFELKKNKIDFVACDLPEFNTLTLAVFAGMAQHEREIISARTKSALQAAKKRGVKLGNPNWAKNRAKAKRDLAKARQRSAEVRRAKAGNKWRYSQERVIAMELQREGKSLREIAKRLKKKGYKTATGKDFHATTVKRLLS